VQEGRAGVMEKATVLSALSVAAGFIAYKSYYHVLAGIRTPMKGPQYQMAFKILKDRVDDDLDIASVLANRINTRNPTSTNQAILSVGAGNGTIEALMIGMLKSKPSLFMAIEPNESFIGDLKRKISSATNGQGQVENVGWNEFKTDAKFDVILMCHSIYYLGWPADVIKRAFSMLNPKGTLVLVVAAQRPDVVRLSPIYNPRKSLGGKFRDLFNEAGFSFTSQRIKIDWNVTDLPDLPPKEKDAIVSMACNYDITDEPAALKQEMFDKMMSSSQEKLGRNGQKVRVLFADSRVFVFPLEDQGKKLCPVCHRVHPRN